MAKKTDTTNTTNPGATSQIKFFVNDEQKRRIRAAAGLLNTTPPAMARELVLARTEELLIGVTLPDPVE